MDRIELLLAIVAALTAERNLWMRECNWRKVNEVKVRLGEAKYRLGVAKKTA